MVSGMRSLGRRRPNTRLAGRWRSSAAGRWSAGQCCRRAGGVSHRLSEPSPTDGLVANATALSVPAGVMASWVLFARQAIWSGSRRTTSMEMRCGNRTLIIRAGPELAYNRDLGPPQDRPTNAASRDQGIRPGMRRWPAPLMRGPGRTFIWMTKAGTALCRTTPLYDRNQAGWILGGWRSHRDLCWRAGGRDAARIRRPGAGWTPITSSPDQPRHRTRGITPSINRSGLAGRRRSAAIWNSALRFLRPDAAAATRQAALWPPSSSTT